MLILRRRPGEALALFDAVSGKHILEITYSGYADNAIIIETRSRHFLDRKLASLRSEGLFPLPDRHYTTKYTWFRRMTNSSLGLSLLMRALPLLKKER